MNETFCNPCQPWTFMAQLSPNQEIAPTSQRFTNGKKGKCTTTSNPATTDVKLGAEWEIIFIILLPPTC